MSTTKYKFGTRAIHAGQEPDPSTGAIMTPIYQTSTYVQESPGKHKGYAYARGKNPTRVALEKCIASLENAKHGLCFSSGQGAEDGGGFGRKPESGQGRQARGRASGDQGPVLHGGCSHDRLLEHPRRVHADL